MAEYEDDKTAEEYKSDYLSACNTIADMHKAALGEVRGPRRGVVEDVEDLKTNYDRAVAERDALRAALARYEDPATIKQIVGIAASTVAGMTAPIHQEGSAQ